MGKQWGIQFGVSVMKGSASCLCPTAQQILNVLHNLFTGLYWIDPRGNASADVFSPFKQRFNTLALWGDYSNISHILAYLESYIFC